MGCVIKHVLKPALLLIYSSVTGIYLLAIIIISSHVPYIISYIFISYFWYNFPNIFLIFLHALYTSWLFKIHM